MAIGLILITNDKLQITRISLKEILTDGKIYATLVIGALPPLYSYLFFENMEHGWYLAGYISLCVLGGGLRLVFRD